MTAVRWDAGAPAWLGGWAARAGLTVAQPGPDDPAGAGAGVTDLEWVVDPALPDRGGPYAAVTRDEEYRIATTTDRGRLRSIRVTGRTQVALRRAARDVARGLAGEDWPDPGTTQGPAFAVRGLLEGFYGPPWRRDDRVRMIADAADLGLTHVMVAPKDDASQRREWWHPLGEAACAELAELVAVARHEQVRLVCAVSPGLSIRWSSPESFEQLLGRFRQLHALGIREGALLLDDIPDTLTDPEDARRYPDVASAHTDLVARWARALRELDPGWRLAVCPLVYHGRGDEPYVVTLGAGLPPDVDIMWTGREICSRTIDLMDGATFWRSTSRPPLWWDNYPVNDVAMRNRLHIGPLLGRDPHLFRVSAGLFANAMDLPECTRIPLGTIADYLWDPQGYDPQRSWERSLRRVAGDAAPLVRELADNVRTSCLPDTESPRLAGTLERAWRARSTGDAAESARILREAAARIDEVAAALRSDAVANTRLRDELAPWVDEYAVGAEDLRAAAEVTERRDGGTGALLPRRRVVGLSRPQVFGDVVDMFLTDLADEHP